MDIFLVTNDRTGYLEMIFSSEEQAVDWLHAQAKATGDTYSISVEEMC
jgi:hypothetical protein